MAVWMRKDGKDVKGWFDVNGSVDEKGWFGVNDSMDEKGWYGGVGMVWCEWQYGCEGAKLAVSPGQQS